VIEDLRRALASAVVVDPPPLPWTQVLFGAFVTVCNQSGEKMTYRLVGVDETDLEKNYISWRSPIAKALIKAKIGEQAHIRAPGGEQQLTIVDIAYQL
jgi:transcription elongation factor GreB